MLRSMRYKRLFLDAAPMPEKVSGDAGYDLPCYGDVTLRKGIPTSVSTGIAVEIPPGWVGIACGRSGNAFKHKVIAFHVGMIDSSYRGEVKVLLFSQDQDILLGHGDKIAQLVIVPHLDESVEEVDELSDTERGAGGFGSTGLAGILMRELTGR